MSLSFQWQAFADGVDCLGRPWVIEDRMHPRYPERECRVRVLTDQGWQPMTPEEFAEIPCPVGKAAR